MEATGCTSLQHRKEQGSAPRRSAAPRTHFFGTMCGILGIFDARRLRHRGPDWSGYQLLSRAPEGAGLKKSGSGTLLGIGANSSSESLTRRAARVRPGKARTRREQPVKNS
ncbi:hypothetical protein JL720_4310 [Aureococcus anophagefferens]|nr:hypothetical protein JL720_4310 [Aureococcus anophagefferens]